MARTARIAPGGLIYHVLNRGVGKTPLFNSRKDHEAFQLCLVETLAMAPMRVLAYSVMKTHWHLLLWPKRDGELAAFMMRLTNTHVRRWLTAHNQVGSGHLYQGRYKSFAIQDDAHLSTVERYIVRNPVRAKVVERAQEWMWGSLGQGALREPLRAPLTMGPIPHRRDWLEWVNLPQTAAEEEAIRRCIRQSRPFGDERWMTRTMKRLGWSEPGRPKKRRSKSGAVPVFSPERRPRQSTMARHTDGPRRHPLHDNPARGPVAGVRRLLCFAPE